MSLTIHYPKNINKYHGNIVEMKRGYKFRNNYFKNSDYNSPEDAYNATLNYKKQWCKDNNKIVNTYRIIEDYVLVHLNKDYYMKVDPSHMSIVEKYKWKMQNNCSYPTTFIPESERAEDERAYIPFHEMAFRFKNVNHKNMDKLDYRPNNIEEVTKTKKKWRSYHPYHADLRENNVSGYTGVYKVKTKKYEYWQVRGVDYNGKKIAKKFSVTRYGDTGAKSMAIDYRNRYINHSCVNHIANDH